MSQRLEVGVEGGVRTTGDVSGTLAPESKRYIIGPKVEIRLPLHLSVEFDALYRRFGFTGDDYFFVGNIITRERANSWEFPMILKYRIPVVPGHPFVGAGYAPRTVHGTDVSSGYFNSDSVRYVIINERSDTSYSVTQGVVISAGLSLGVGPVRFSPELRYVHWIAPFLDESFNPGNLYLSRQNEVFVLFGISWH